MLDAMAELKTGNYRLCNECIHHTVKCEEKMLGGGEGGGCGAGRIIGGEGENKVRVTVVAGYHHTSTQYLVVVMQGIAGFKTPIR